VGRQQQGEELGLELEHWLASRSAVAWCERALWAAAAAAAGLPQLQAVGM
jgi:hypothetical protein